MACTRLSRSGVLDALMAGALGFVRRILATTVAVALADATPLAVPCKAVFLLGRMELVAVLLGAGWG